MSDTDTDTDTDEDYIPVRVVATADEMKAAGLLDSAPAAHTVLDRLLRAGISAERAGAHLASGDGDGRRRTGHRSGHSSGAAGPDRAETSLSRF